MHEPYKTNLQEIYLSLLASPIQEAGANDNTQAQETEREPDTSFEQRKNTKGSNRPSSGDQSWIGRRKIKDIDAFKRVHILNLTAPAVHPLRSRQLFHIVLFKWYRADVFRVAEETEINFKVGDSVIVETGHGADLGTLAHTDLDWQTAMKHKEEYYLERRCWLAMYLSGVVINETGRVNAEDPNSQSWHQKLLSAQRVVFEPNFIKRIAQTHEIRALSEKEGNETAVEEFCRQKVGEHNLNITILDAEFQMDWRKLTISYYADSYVDLHMLVAELFEAYQARVKISEIQLEIQQIPGRIYPRGIGPDAIKGEMA